MTKNREQFGPDAQPFINRFKYMLAFFGFFFYLETQGFSGKNNIGGLAEWLSFFGVFIIRFQLAGVMPYTSRVLKDQ